MRCMLRLVNVELCQILLIRSLVLVGILNIENLIISSNYLSFIKYVWYVFLSGYTRF